jgi:hypothetical protein
VAAPKGEVTEVGRALASQPIETLVPLDPVLVVRPRREHGLR